MWVNQSVTYVGELDQLRNTEAQRTHRGATGKRLDTIFLILSSTCRLAGLTPNMAPNIGNLQRFSRHLGNPGNPVKFSLYFEWD
jgi:hypothetical protein